MHTQKSLTFREHCLQKFWKVINNTFQVQTRICKLITAFFCIFLHSTLSMLIFPTKNNYKSLWQKRKWDEFQRCDNSKTATNFRLYLSRILLNLFSSSVLGEIIDPSSNSISIEGIEAALDFPQCNGLKSCLK